jgi:hypothetical protein
MLSLLLDGNTSTLLLRTAFNVTLLITRDYRRTISGVAALQTRTAMHISKTHTLGYLKGLGARLVVITFEFILIHLETS